MIICSGAKIIDSFKNYLLIRKDTILDYLRTYHREIIWYVYGDLHLEFSESSMFLKQNKVPVAGKVLVLAGNIFCLKNKIAPRAKFWKWAPESCKRILAVPDNHEYYNYSDIMVRSL